MRNLAGHPEATDFAELELRRAGVPVVTVEPSGEVGARVAGELGPYRFERAWYYWVVTGPVPLDVAERLYADPEGHRSVRVAGHCGCPSPAEWAEWFTQGGEKIWQESTPEGKLECVEYRDGEYLCAPDPSQVPGARAYVTSYHVDTQEGLDLLVRELREFLTHWSAVPDCMVLPGQIKQNRP